MKETFKKLADALERRIPLLTQWSPDGWQDFRDGTPETLRCGLFVNAYDTDPDALAGAFGAPDPPVSIHGVRFQTSVGSAFVARAIQRQLMELVPAECFTSAPEVGQVNERFNVKFELDKTKAEVLVSVLDPPPGRPFPGCVPRQEEQHGWRVGGRNKLNVYEGNRSVCQCHNEVDATRIVAALSRQPEGCRMKCDIVFLAHGRPEFMRASADALYANTNWDRVDRVVWYTDGPTVHMSRVPGDSVLQSKVVLVTDALGGPVNIMNHYLANNPAAVWAKIDNDVIVPPGWLDAGLNVMEAHPELSFLGLEPPASRTRSPYGGKLPPAPEFATRVMGPCVGPTPHVGCYAPCDAIGGVGFMRTAAWSGCTPMRQHSTYGGFTDWQLAHPSLVKGWIVPPLKLFLLDRIPIEPWASLSKKYEAAGEQRYWTRYPMEAAPSLWEWWL